MINQLNFSPPATGEGAVITQLRGELSDARNQLQQMRTQLLAAEEDAQLHAQDVSGFYCCVMVLIIYHPFVIHIII